MIQWWGGLGSYKSVKCFISLEVGKESTVKSFLEYIVETLCLFQPFVRNLCLSLAQARIVFSALCLHDKKF